MIFALYLEMHIFLLKTYLHLFNMCLENCVCLESTLLLMEDGTFE